MVGSVAPADLLSADKRQLVGRAGRERNPSRTVGLGMMGCCLRLRSLRQPTGRLCLGVPRNDEAREFFRDSFLKQLLRMQILSRGAPRARVLHVLVPPERRGQGRPGGRCTRGPRAKRLREVRVDHRYRRDQPGLPCAVVYGLLRALLGEPDFVVTVVSEIRGAYLRENLAPASGRQDHTTSPSAIVPLVDRHIRVHRNPPRVS
jgi:hypothetical protein